MSPLLLRCQGKLRPCLGPEAVLASTRNGSVPRSSSQITRFQIYDELWGVGLGEQGVLKNKNHDISLPKGSEGVWLHIGSSFLVSDFRAQEG